VCQRESEFFSSLQTATASFMPDSSRRYEIERERVSVRERSRERDV